MKTVILLCALLSTSVFANFFSNGSKTPETKADVLVLMDNSGSMMKYAQTAGGGVAALVNELQYNSINLGLITNGPLQPGQKLFRTTPVNGTMMDVLQGLMRDINALDFNGSPSEEFYSAILKTTEPEYSKFYREGADVIIYIITDEDEERVKSPMNTLDFIRELKSRLNLSKLKINLLTESDKCKTHGPQISEMVLWEAVRAVGGQVYDICPQEPNPAPQQ